MVTKCYLCSQYNLVKPSSVLRVSTEQTNKTTVLGLGLAWSARDMYNIQNNNLQLWQK